MFNLNKEKKQAFALIGLVITLTLLTFQNFGPVESVNENVKVSSAGELNEMINISDQEIATTKKNIDRNIDSQYGNHTQAINRKTTVTDNAPIRIKLKRKPSNQGHVKKIKKNKNLKKSKRKTKKSRKILNKKLNKKNLTKKKSAAKKKQKKKKVIRQK